MNKLRYRIVFNKARGLQMVVAEHVRSGGKAASGVACSMPPPPVLRPARLATAVALALYSLCAPTLAQVVADPGAPGGQRPTVLNTANGVIQVNIQTPSAAGVSRNAYKQFDVPNSGAVLNNSRTDTPTQLGGWVQANPWLAQREAKVILNEVNSSNPSRLRGYIEVAGPRADVIIANPAGISVDGGGFINVSRATLTSGTARMTDGRIDGFTLARGQVNIDGAGLDASSTDYTAIIARSVAVNAALWAKQLRLATGTGEVAIGGDNVQASPGAAQGETPNYAIDVSALGGMYANRIFLVGTEAGVGVRNAGTIGAASGELIVTSDGRLENSGRLVGKETVQVDARTVANSGTLAGDTGVRVTASALKNSGVIQTAAETTLAIQADLDNSGTLAGDTGVHVTAGALKNSGVIQSVAEAKLAIHGDLDNSGGTVRALRVDMRSAAGAILNREGSIEQGGAGLDVRAAALANMAGGQIGNAAPVPVIVVAGATDLSAATGPTYAAADVANGDLSVATNTTPPLPVANGVIESTQSLDNRGGRISAGGVISLAAGNIDNSGGKLYLRELAFDGVSFANRGGVVNIVRDFSVTAHAFDNSNGSIQARAATFDIAGMFDNAHGTVDAALDLTISAGSIFDAGGTLASQQALRIDSGAARTDGAVWLSGTDATLHLGSFDHAGKIIAARDLNLTAGPLTSHSGNLYAGSNIAVVADEIDNQHGTIQAGDHLAVSVTGKLANSGLLEARSTGATLTLDAGTVDNAGGRIVNGGIGRTSIHSAGALTNVDGVISANGVLRVDAGQRIDNNGGHIFSGAALDLTGARLGNRGGVVTAHGPAQLTIAGAVDNTAGTLQSMRNLALSAAGGLDNSMGTIELIGSVGRLDVHAGAIDNADGHIVNAGAGDTHVAVDTTLRSSGVISANGALAVTAGAIDTGGVVFAQGDLSMRALDRLDNTGDVSSAAALRMDAGAVVRNAGNIVAAGSTHLTAGAIDNDGGQLSTAAGSAAAITLHAGVLSNLDGAVLSDGDLHLAVEDSADNSAGVLQAVGSIDAAVKGAVVNGKGVIEALGSTATMTLHAGAMDNGAGRILNAGKGTTSISVDGALASSGWIQAQGALYVSAQDVHLAAGSHLVSGGDLLLAVRQQFDNAGTVGSQGRLTVDGAANIDNAGQIISSGDAAVKAGRFANDGGTIATADGSGARLDVTADHVSNVGGTIRADRTVAVRAGNAFDNAGGTIQSAAGLTLDAGGALGNQDGTIELASTDGLLAVSAAVIDSRGGRIVNVGRGDTMVSATGGVVNGGLLAGNGLLTLQAGELANLAGATLSAGGALALDVDTHVQNAGTVTSRGALTFTQAAATLDNSGAINTASRAVVDVARIVNAGGSIVSDEALSLRTQDFANQGGTVQAAGALDLAIGSSFNNNSGTVRTGDALRLSAGSLNNTRGMIESASTMQLQTGHLENLGGRIVNAGLGDMEIAAGAGLTNSGLIGGNGNLSLRGASLDNLHGGVVTAGTSMTLALAQQMRNAGSVDSGAGLAVSVGASLDNSGDIRAAEQARIDAGSLRNDGGRIATGTDLALTASALSNRSGTIVADAGAQIRATQFDNVSGMLQSAGALTLNVDETLDNAAGTIETRTTSGTLGIRAGAILNGSGRIASAADSTLGSNGLLQTGGLIQAAGILGVSAATVQVTGAGKLVSGSDLRIAAGSLFENAGDIGSQGALAVEASSATVRNSGNVVANGPVELTAARLNNDGGQIATAHGAGTDVTLRADSLSNAGGTVIADGAAHIATTGTFDNDGGAVQAARALDIRAGGLTNAGGSIASTGSGAAIVESAATLANGGLIAGNGDLQIVANTLVNEAAGKISAVGALDLAMTIGLQNAGAITSNGALTFEHAAATFDNSGTIAASGAVALTVAALRNDGGNIASDAGLALHAQSLNNRAGNIVALGNADITVAGAVDNSNGALRTGGDLHLAAAAALNNNAGAIESVGALGVLSMQAGSIDNLAGRIVNGGFGATSVAASGEFVNSGVVAGNGDLAVAAAILENLAAGAITSGNALTLSTTSQLHNAGSIASSGTFDLQAAGARVTNISQFLAGGRIAIAAGAFNNDGGQIATAGGSAADVVLQADSFSNRNGAVLSDRDANITSRQGLDNQAGTIQAANALHVSAGGALNNHGGIIEDGGAGAAMSVAAQSIDNTLGRIVNAGTGATDVRSAADFVNSGTIAGGGTLALVGTSLQNAAGGTISSGADLALAFSRQFANLGGAVSSAGTVTFNQAGAAFRNSGVIVAHNGVGIVAGAIDNTAGQLVTVRTGGGNLFLRGDSLDNRGGVMFADGNMDLAIAGAIDNIGGTLQAAHDAQVAAGTALVNDGGTIETAGPFGNLTVRAGTIDNGTGRINNAGTGATVVTSQGWLSNNGMVAGSGSLFIEAATLQNGLAGTLGASGNVDLAVREQVDNAGLLSSGGMLNFNQSGAVFNNSGTAVSGANTTIIAAAINNHGQLSTVRGAGGDLFLSGVLNNSNGKLLADGNATLLLSGTLNNTSGTVQAAKDLLLSTNDTIANEGGVIETLGAGSALTLEAGAIANAGGRIVNIGHADTRLTAAGAITNGGTIGGNGNVVLASQTLANLASGTISSGANLDLGITQELDNEGVINSAGTLTFNEAGAVFKNSNHISAGNSITIAAGEFNNEGGQISTGAGSGAGITLQAQTVNNASGHIISDRDMSLTAGLLLGGGEFSSGRDLAVSLQGDYVNNSAAAQLRARRDLSLAVTGSLQNTATFEAVRALTLSANQVDNLAAATIQAQSVTINAAADIRNAGEINGAATLDLHAGGTLDNHAGMTGGDVALTAQNVNNTGSLALLGATADMTLNVANTLNNTGNATIYSAAGLAASAATLNNLGSTVEAAGDMTLVIGAINNIRENVSIVQVKTLDETRHMTLPSWYSHGDNNNEYDPKSALYRPLETYFVNPADILEDTEVVTPDGYMIHRVVFRTHANDSAFFAAGSGAYGKYGHRERLTTTEGTRTMYYLERVNDIANPDQGGASGNGNPLFDSATMVWDGPAVSFSSSYGSCSTNCVRFMTLPGYDDPANIINQREIRELAPSKDRLEIYRDAHYTAVEDRLADGAGTQARIISGGNMQIITGLLHNQYGQVMANGFLDLTGADAVVNEGATLYRRYNFDGTWTTENHTVTPYTMPTLSQEIGTTRGVINGGLGVNIDARNFSNIDVTAGTAGIVRDAIHIVGSGTGNGSAAGVSNAPAVSGNSAGLSGTAAGVIGQAAATGGLVSTHWIAVTGGAEQVHGNNGSIVTTGGQSAPGDTSGNAGPRSLLGNGSVGNGNAFNDAKGSINGVVVGANLGGAAGARTNQSRASAAAKGGVVASGTTAAAALAIEGRGALADSTLQQGTVMRVAPSGLFTQNPAANGKYLFETRPQFANHQDWASSNYLLAALGMDGSLMQKRLGDGFYEQRLVREQIAELTGRGTSNGISDDTRYQELLSNAVTVAKQFGLRPGIALTAEQVSRLTSDIVWMESQSVRLPDGSIETVLVPKVYLAHLDQNMIRGGALVTGANVYINTQEDIVNRGGVIDSGTGRTILISGRDIVNEGGTIRGGDVLAAAARDVRNESTSATQVYGSAQTSGSYTVLASQAAIAASGTLAIQAGRDVSDVAGKISAANASIVAGRDISFNALTTGSTYRATVGQDKQDNSATGHALSQIATTGTLGMSAGRDLSLSGTQMSIGTDGILQAGRALTVGSVMNQVKTDEHNDASNKHYEKRAQENQTVVGSSIGAGGALQLTAGLSETAALTIRSSAVTSTGALSLGASGDVVIGGAQERHVLDNASHHESSGILKSKSTTTTDYSSSNTLIGSSISGGTVLVNSGHDIRITGSGVVADGDVEMIAKNSVAITAGVSNTTESHHSEVKESGFLSGGGFGISYGTRTTTTDQQQDATLQSGQSRSMVGSLDGNLNIRAGERIDIAGSDVSAGNDITMLAKAISITPGLDQIDGEFSRKFTQDGLTLSIGGGAINAVQTVQAMGSAAAQTGNTRMKALAAATAAKAVSGTISDIARNGISASVSLTAGHTESEQTQTTVSRAHFGSTVAAGGNLTIVATGGGQQSNIDVVGSDLSAKHNILLAADNKVSLLAAQNLDSQHSQTSSKSAAVGVAAGFSSKGGVSFGLTGSVSAGRGTEDGEGVTQINSHVLAGEQLLISSGGDLNVKGAVAEGAQVIANVGGNLNIESLQDKAKFDSKNQSISVSATVGYGTNFSGGVNAGTIRSDYASVQEQSGVRAGNGGFQINVAGNTDLKGGVISSTAAGAALSSLVTGTLTHSDILNYSKVDAAAVGFGGSAAVGGLGFSGSGTNLVRFEKPGATAGITGAASMSTAQDDVTRSAIGPGTILIKNEIAQIALTGTYAAKSVSEISRDVSTGVDTSGRVANKFDLDSVRATLTIASNFSSMAARTVGDYATTKLDEASNLKALAASETDPIKRAQLFEQADSLQETWKEGGAGRVALHATVGGLTGGVDGALGAGATALSTPLIASRIDSLDVPASVKSALLLSAGAAVGAVAGGEAGALASLNEIDNNYLSHKRPAGFNKRSEQEQFEKARDGCTAGDKAACNERDRWIAISKGRDQVITNVCASGPSSECHDVIAQAIDSGNKVIFDSKRQAVVYKIGSPEIGNAPKVGQGSFHEQLSLSFRDALEGEVLGGVGKWVLGAAGRALGLSTTNVAAEIAEIEIGRAWPSAVESVGNLSIAANRAGNATYAVKPASSYTMADEIGNMVGTRSALVTSESNALQRIAANNSVDTGSAARIARIDEISKANWARRVDEMINSQDYVFRYLTQDGFNASTKYNSVRGFTSTNFSSSSAEIMSGAQIFEQWPGAPYTGPVKYGVAIPVSKLNGFSVARPMGGAAVSGWEVFANSYPKAGAGHFSQFLINPVPLNDVFIFTLKP